MPFLFFDPVYFLFALPAMFFAMWAQWRVQSSYQKWSQVPSAKRLSGMDVAKVLMRNEGLDHVQIEHINGVLTDHYDPMNRVVRLSEPVYYESSISAISVACHEVGHAIQHANSYPMLVLRHKMFPLVNLVSGIAPFLLIAGFIFSVTGLIGAGIVFFSLAVVFQLVTLPVEFNASSRARDLMISEGFIRSEEEGGVAKVLNAAALTYVAAALISLLELLKFIMIFASNRE